MNRLIGGTGLIAACFLCWGIRSHALEQDVILKAEDHKVEGPWEGRRIRPYP